LSGAAVSAAAAVSAVAAAVAGGWPATGAEAVGCATPAPTA
jgi:hypothetical protein